MRGFLPILCLLLLVAGCGRSRADPADDLLRAFASARGAEADALAHELIDLADAAVPALIRGLGDEDRDVRQGAALILGHLRVLGAMPHLVERLRDHDARVRSVAAEALGRIGAPAVLLVAPCLEERSPEVREAAALAIWYMGRDARLASGQLLAALACERNDDAFQRMCWALVRCGPDAAPAVQHLISRMEDSDDRISFWAQDALGDMGAWVVPTLEATLRDASSEPIASGVAYALGQIGEPAARAVPVLLKALSHEHEDVRLSAVCALGRIGGEPATVVPALTHLLSDPSGFAHAQALEALRRFGPQAAMAVPALLSLFRAADEERKHLVVRTLGAIGPAAEDAIPILLPRLASPAWRSRVAAMQALQAVEREVPEASQPLVDALADEDDTVRSAAAIALRTVDPSRFRTLGASLVPALLEGTRRIDHDQQMRALQALASLGPVAGDALPELRAWQERCEAAAPGDKGIGDYAERRVSPAQYLVVLKATIRAIEAPAEGD